MKECPKFRTVPPVTSKFKVSVAILESLPQRKHDRERKKAKYMLTLP